ncbi:MAG: S-adenosylmethionine:tRNA ribosyltransferase-isomerase [Acidimicrobiales bacterium]
MGATPTAAPPLDIEVPAELVADRPAEALGRRRDHVRMLVARRATGQLTHARAIDLPLFLERGDVLVVNRSPTLPAAVPSSDGSLVVHLSTHLGAGRWVVEVREPCGAGTRPHRVDHPQTVPLAGGAVVRLRHARSPVTSGGAARLWVADVLTPVPLPTWLAREGRPIRYGCASTAWPIEAYQTIFATRPWTDPGHGSAEMPSAARPFTRELVRELVTAGVVLAPITLHTGVSSLESHEAPYAERFRVPVSTARRVNEAHATGHRVIAVGTTAARALETDARHGTAHPGDGWTELVITPHRGVQVVDGIISGWHEPEASHLQLMEAVAGRALLEASYGSALTMRYRWHEFGDLHLVLP